MSANFTDPIVRQWQLRHEPAGRTGMARYQRVCPSCHHYYSPGFYRSHLRSEAHQAGRGWWK